MIEFEAFIEKHLPVTQSYHPHYNDALQTMILAGGKRFRPALLLSVVNAYEPLLKDAAYHVAFAIETLHTYSLIHDDLPSMDNADLRRGHQTLHIKFDEVSAILAGDALNTYAFELLSNAPLSAEVRIALVRELSSSGGVSGMVLGQALDCHFENIELSLEQLNLLHNKKTAALIAASLVMGAIIVGRDELVSQLREFGEDVGLLFQIQDDIIDVTKSSVEAGKTTGVDSEKNSFVNLLGLDGAVEAADEKSRALSEKLNNFDENLREQLNILLKEYLYRHKEKTDG